MGRFKKGKRKKSPDLWLEAGGRNVIIISFLNKGFACGCEPTSEQWSKLFKDVFKNTCAQKEKWLRVIWNEDRRGVKTEVYERGEC